MKHNSFLLYCDQFPMIQKLSNEQAGMLFKKIHKYCGNGREEPDFKDDLVLDMVFTAHKSILDKDNESYVKKCEKNKKIAEDRWKEERKIKGVK